MNSLTAPLALLGLAVALAPALADDEPEGDLAKLQGTWQAKVGPNQDVPITVVIKGKTVKATFTNSEGEQRSLDGKLKLDETTTPRHIDWVEFTMPDGSAIEDNQAIYRFDGDDQVEICNGGPGNERPTEFKQVDGGPPNLIILKRVKDGA